MPPLIGITSTPSSHISTTLKIDRPIDALDRSYVDCVATAGATPALLPVVSPSQAAAYVERLDGLVLSGGGDVDPSMYGAQRDERTSGVHSDRDAFELALTHAALDAGLPTLFICRGMQVLNVARGGTLHQHLQEPDDRAHVDASTWSHGSHRLRVKKGSLLASLVGTEIAVNSLHHQGVDRLGEGLTVTARDDDDVIEALEDPDNPKVLGVQWHPEMMFGDSNSRQIFQWLVNLAGDAT